MLELGGKDPLIILADADLDYALDAAVWGAFLHQGEICMSTERIIIEEGSRGVHRPPQERAESLPMGDPTDPATAIGPLINQRAVDKVHPGRRGGGRRANLVTGGRHDNLVYHPTVVTDVTRDMQLFREQTFGPVAIVVVDDAEEALAVANDSDYGLSSGILARLQPGSGHGDASRDRDGPHRDQTVNDEPQAPFGGVQGSGYGRFGGQSALDEFTELRWINVQRVPRTFP